MCIWHFDSFTQTLSDQEDVCHHPLLLKKLNLSEILKEKNADLKLCQDRNGRILFNHLPGCNRSSSPPICTFGCVEFAAAFLPSAEGVGKTNKYAEKWPESLGGTHSTSRETRSHLMSHRCKSWKVRLQSWLRDCLGRGCSLHFSPYCPSTTGAANTATLVKAGQSIARSATALFLVAEHTLALKPGHGHENKFSFLQWHGSVQTVQQSEGGKKRVEKEKKEWNEVCGCRACYAGSSL